MFLQHHRDDVTCLPPSALLVNFCSADTLPRADVHLNISLLISDLHLNIPEAIPDLHPSIIPAARVRYGAAVRKLILDVMETDARIRASHPTGTSTADNSAHSFCSLCI